MTTKELVDYFAEKNLPEGPIKFNKYTTVEDPAKFVASELNILKISPDYKGSDSCQLRLIEFKEWLENGQPAF
ncbi:DUF6965 family protein [Dyadobacter crusticola]|uniref:DUF6965 family protein n=1 Tax=Dyadobacter crusticola TaxID=292407 RepID=UPI0004E0F692|nr:hypothetical protein [Dyadobacter crusticola]